MRIEQKTKLDGHPLAGWAVCISPAQHARAAQASQNLRRNDFRQTRGDVFLLGLWRRNDRADHCVKTTAPTTDRARKRERGQAVFFVSTMHPATYLQAATLALVALTAFAQALDPSLLWGTYRPQIYFGLRTALPRSILSGLLWFDPSSPQGLANARHECSDDHKLAGYAWKYHDGRTFGIQEVKDIQTNYLIETSWLKTGNGSWAARVKGSVIDPSECGQPFQKSGFLDSKAAKHKFSHDPSPILGKSAVISPIYYFSLEDESAFFEPIFEDGSYEDGIPQDNQENGRLFQATIKEPVGSFSVRFDNTPDAPNQPYHPPADQLKAEHEAEFREARDKWHYLGARVPTETVWRGKEWVLSDISTSVRAALNEYGSDERKLPFLGDLMTLADEVRSAPNLFAIQRTFQGDFGFDVFFDAENDAKGSFLDGKSLTMALEASKEAYDEKLRAKLSSITAIGSEDLYKYARDLTSSIVGGIGYYFGQGIVDRSFSRSYDIAVGSGALDLDDGGEAQPELTEEHELLTATPSRSMFPRGFYWDEGFHLAHIGMLDNDVSLEIFKSWINLVDEDGWVAREQILGDEARSRVPEQFQTQYPLYANPPTLIMALTTYLDRINAKHGQGSLFTSGVDRNQVVMASSSEDYTSSKYVDDPSLARDLLADLYPKLRAHYMWFRKTQRGEIKEWDRKARARGEAFRWRGRTKDHVLTSGLDDYPRAPTPHTGELHLDLISWMGFFADTMRKLAEVVGEKDDEEEYERHYEGIVKNIDGEES